MSPHEELVAHEKLCAERYSTIHKRLDRIESMLNRLIWGILIAFGSIILMLVSTELKAAETTINYKGQPVPSAMAPSMSAYSQDVCAVPAGAIIAEAAVSFELMREYCRKFGQDSVTELKSNLAGYRKKISDFYEKS